MTTLRVVLDEMLSPEPTGTARYTEELAKALIAAAPPGSDVAGVVASSPETDYELIAERLPGLSDLFKSALTIGQLTRAWQHGFTRMPGGMLHAPSLLAPLSAHDRVNARGNQVVVTLHDVDAWTHPESMTPRKVAWTKAMVHRAFRYADAIVVPTHAIASELDDIIDFSERVRVIGGAVSQRLTLPGDADARAERLGLPRRYLISVGAHSRGLAALLAAVALPGGVDLPLYLVGADDGLAAAIQDAGVPDGRVVPLGQLTDPDLAVAMDRATVFVFPSASDGFGMQLLEAFSFGTPVVHAQSASLVEIAGGAGVSVPLEPERDYPARLAQAITAVAENPDVARRLGILGQDRTKMFSWRASAEQVWQLHADL